MKINKLGLFYIFHKHIFSVAAIIIERHLNSTFPRICISRGRTDFLNLAILFFSCGKLHRNRVSIDLYFLP